MIFKEICMNDKNNLDKIHIRDLKLHCIIGINENERTEKQDVIINVTLYADLKKASSSDNIDDSVDYKIMKKNIISMVEKSSFFLIEKLASEIANLCLGNKMVKIVTVTLDKPRALRFARSVAVEITRYSENY